MSIVLLLANTMDKYGSLEEESILRAKEAAKIVQATSGAEILALGWPYREDSEIAIAEALKKFLVEGKHLDPSLINVELCSRDTVGDAIFSRLLLEDYLKQRDITVITSDYHARRVKEVFDFFFFGWANVSVIGVPTASSHLKLDHEESSLEAFRKTFDGVDPGDIKSALRVLLSQHPFYNGVIHNRYDIESHRVCKETFHSSKSH